MAAAAWERFTRHRWLPKAAAAVLAAALAAGFLLVRSERRDARNAEVLETACGGVLPREAVRGLLPGDETWELRDDLDLTGPSGRGPRTLLRCSVGWDEFWGGGYGGSPARGGAGAGRSAVGRTAGRTSSRRGP
ncbi:hypothetical protein SCALM49S_09765 [Streptomyces californicus]